MNQSRFWGFVLLVVVFFVLLRVGGFRLALAEDEEVWALSAIAPGGFDYQVIPHPPLAVFFYSIAGLVGSAWALRMVPLIFSVASLVLVAIIARRQYGERAALISVSIMAVSAWSVLASVQIDMDGSILVFWMLCAMYFFLDGLDGARARSYAIAGFFCGLGMLSKTGFAVFLLALAAYLGIRFLRRELTIRAMASASLVFIVAGLIFAFFPLGAHLLGSSLADRAGVHATNYFFGFFTQDWLNVLSILAQAVVLASPLLVGLVALAFLRPRREDLPFLVVIGAFALFYLFITTASYRPFERYWMPMIPFIALVGGRVIAGVKGISLWRVSAGCIAGFVAMVIVSSMLRPSLYPLFPKDEYVNRFLSLDWNFLFPFHGASGPLAFFVSFILVLLAFAACALLVGWYAAGRDARVLEGFLVVAVAFNLLLIGELLFSVSTPDMNAAADGVLAYAATQDLREPIFLYQSLGLSSFNRTGITPRLIYGVQFTDEELAREVASGGTVLLVDFPSAARDSAVWRVLDACEKRAVFETRGIEAGYVFSCQ